jgi:WD40 repeat protein
MLTPEERLYLIDFGVARFYKPDKLRDTIAFGSPGYASPEQYGRAQTTPRADIYSLGALLHQLLTGVDPSLDPFHFQSLRAYDHSLPRALEKLVAQMLEDDRELRPTSSTEVGHQLRSIAASPSVLKRHRVANPAQGGQAPARTILPAFSTLGVPVFRYRGHKGSVTRLAWSPDGSVLASLEYEQALHIWQAFQAAPAIIAHPQARDLAWSPDGRVLALAGSDHVVRLWHVGQHPHWWRMAALSLGFLADIYERHASPVEALCWSPDGQQIASLETNGSIHIWQARTRACLLVYPGHADVGEDLAWSPDGTRLASCGIDQMVRVWRATDGESRWRWRVKGSIVHTLAWSPDSHYLACGASDSTVHVWDFTHNRRVFIYRAHKKGSIKALAWSPDGQRIASASSDGTVHVWGALTGGHAFRYHEHRECVGAVAWSPDGQHIASASSDAEVHIWKTV